MVSNGGVLPVWSPDSQRRYYRRDQSIFVVRNQSAASSEQFRAGPPEPSRYWGCCPAPRENGNSWSFLPLVRLDNQDGFRPPP